MKIIKKIFYLIAINVLTLGLPTIINYSQFPPSKEDTKILILEEKNFEPEEELEIDSFFDNNTVVSLSQTEEIEESEEIQEIVGAEAPPEEELVSLPSWEGEILNARNGVVQGPNGKESYYNLPMFQVVAYMRELGYSAEEFPYWVRDDGCKMFGDYIMIAADLSVYPKGSIVQISLGLAIVCDTGSFVYNGSNRAFDVAVTW